MRIQEYKRAIPFYLFLFLKAQYKSTSEIRPLGLTFLRRLRIEKIDTLSILWIATPCAHILWSSLYEVWQDQDALVGNQIGPNSTT